MTAARKITHTPAGKAMTIREIEAALADARAQGATGDDVPRVHITFSGTLKDITFELSAGEINDRVR